jgi:hypothetical protein
VRGIFIDAARLERIQQVFISLVEGADDKAAMVIIRAQERKATLMGDNAPLRVDPIQLAEVASPKIERLLATKGDNALAVSFLQLNRFAHAGSRSSDDLDL